VGATNRSAADGTRAGFDSRAAAAVAGSIFGIYVVVHLALLSRFPWFVDETYFAWLAQNAQGDPAQRFGALADHKGLLNSWMGALLIHLDVPPMTAMRLISVVSGLVAVAATGFLAWRWESSLRLALVACALVAFIPYMLVNDSVGVYDAFIAAGSMVALALELELARRQRLDVALLLGLTLGALLLSKPTGELAIVLLPASLMMFDWQRETRWRRVGAWAGLVGIALLLAVVMYALTRLSPLAYTPDQQNHRTLGDLLSDPFGNLGTIAHPAFDALWGYLTPPGIALALWGLVRVVRTRDRLGLVAAVWALAAILAFLLLTDMAYPRYGLQAIPPLCLLIAIAALDLWTRARQHFAWMWVALGATALAIPMLLLDGQVLVTPQTAPYAGLDRAQYVTLVSNRQPVREASQIILERAPATFARSTPVAAKSVADLGGWGWAALLVLNGTHYTATPRFVYMDQTSDRSLVNHARFVIVEGDAPPWLSVRRATLVRRWSRAGGGPPVVLYDRGA
jgi:4-amino-4-deoxy-L-arabinose transferase-like glycosyltransferase